MPIPREGLQSADHEYRRLRGCERVHPLDTAVRDCLGHISRRPDEAAQPVPADS